MATPQDQILSPSPAPRNSEGVPLGSSHETETLTPGQVHSHGKPNERRALDRRFEQGLFAYHQGDYSKAMMDFDKTSAHALKIGDYSRFIDCCTYFLRILAEREEFTKIDAIEKQVLSILAKEESEFQRLSNIADTTNAGSATSPLAGKISAKLKSKVLYVLGICSCYQDSRHELAMRRFRESIETAMTSGEKESLAAPLYGIATAHYAGGKYEEALRELDRLEILLSCLPLPDLKSAAELLRALILRNQGDLDGSLIFAWKAFESLKHHPNLVLYLHTLCVLGIVYQRKGDINSSRLYLDLAERSLKRNEFPRIARLIDEAVLTLGSNANSNADLIFDLRSGSLFEKSKGEIRFEGQFVLRDLLRVFLENPGQVFSKEEITARVWHEPYVRDVHDNKIYVTIKRLRSLIELNAKKSNYIIRAKNGYFLNPKVNILIHGNKPASENKAFAINTESQK